MHDTQQCCFQGSVTLWYYHLPRIHRKYTHGHWQHSSNLSLLLECPMTNNMVPSAQILVDRGSLWRRGPTWAGRDKAGKEGTNGVCIQRIWFLFSFNQGTDTLRSSRNPCFVNCNHDRLMPLGILAHAWKGFV